MQPSIILGSSSPRRKQLLSEAGLSFHVIKPLTEELPKPGEAALDYAIRNSLEKAEWTLEQFQQNRLDELLSSSNKDEAIIISADTIVVLEKDIIEKPLDTQDAERILRRLSGQMHTVISAVSMLKCRKNSPQSNHLQTFAISTKVFFRMMEEKEIVCYVATGEPMDKAGAYALQGLGGMFVSRIEGSFSNVIGLPVAEVMETLRDKFSYDIWRRPLS